MNKQTFIKKYKPTNLKDFNLNPDFLFLLQKNVYSDNINIMLVGQPGTGKTSVIDTIVSKYYNTCSSSNYSNNVLYINNLKDQGINYYRNDVKNFCQTTSSIHGRKKYVVLDDIDFMNEQSQQVFRHIIDKYRSKVNFIASCTNVQKVIDSIQSRFISVKMNPIKKDGLHEIMRNVSHIEHIMIQPDAAEFILQTCNFSIKAMLNYLEKFKLLDQDVTLDLAIQTCTNIGFKIFESYTDYIRNGNLHEAIMLLYQLHDNGYSVLDVLDTYFIFIKNTKVFTETEKYRIIPVICKYISAFHEIHENEIELAIFTNNIYKCVREI